MIELNKIYNEDCHIGLKEIPDNSIDAIVTDPPYKYLKHKLDSDWDEDTIFAEFDRIVKPYGFIVFFGRGEAFHRWNYKLNQLGWNFKEEIIWDKSYSSSPVLPISRRHETVSILTKTGSIRRCQINYLKAREFELDKMQADLKRIVSGVGNQKSLEAVKKYLETKTREYKQIETVTKSRLTVSDTKVADPSVTVMRSFEEGLRESSIILERSSRKSGRIHPTQKPVELMKRLINLVTDPGDTICDPFSGSASTAIAAIETERDYICFEKDKEYFDDSVERVENHVSQMTLL